MAHALTYSVSWDAPFDKVEVRFNFTLGYPMTGPSFNDPGEPGEPDDVEVLSAIVTVDGCRHEAPGWLADAFGRLFDDDLLTMGREEAGQSLNRRLWRAA